MGLTYFVYACFCAQTERVREGKREQTQMRCVHNTQLSTRQIFIKLYDMNWWSNKFHIIKLNYFVQSMLLKGTTTTAATTSYRKHKPASTHFPSSLTFYLCLYTPDNREKERAHTHTMRCGILWVQNTYEIRFFVCWAQIGCVITIFLNFSHNIEPNNNATMNSSKYAHRTNTHARPLWGHM